MELLLGILVGLIVGWNVLPQPSWVATLYKRWFKGVDKLDP